MLTWLEKRVKGDHTEPVKQLEDLIKAKYDSDEYLKGRFLVAVEQFDDSSHINSHQYDMLQRVLIVLSALTPFTVGLEAIVLASNILKLFALLLSLLVAILGNYLTTFNLQAKRGAYRLTRESLIAEFYKFHMQIEPYAPSNGRNDRTEDRRKFATEVEKLIKEANESWGGLHQSGGPTI